MVAPLVGYTDTGSKAHWVADPARRTSACNRHLPYIPLTQPDSPDVCRQCLRFGGPEQAAAVAAALLGPLEERVEPCFGICRDCGGEAEIDAAGLITGHGQARMRGGKIVYLPNLPCPGAGHPPEDTP